MLAQFIFSNCDVKTGLIPTLLPIVYLLCCYGGVIINKKYVILKIVEMHFASICQQILALVNKYCN